MTDANSNSSDHSAEGQRDEINILEKNMKNDLPNNNEIYITQSDLNEGDTEVAQNDAVYAGFWLRFWAYLIDIIAIWSLDQLLIKPIFKALNLSQYDFTILSPITIGSAVVFYLYFLLMTKYLGQTLGKMVLGLKVVSLKEESLSWGTVFFREVIGRFIVRTLMFGFTYILVGVLPKKQGLHDIFSDTSVIQEKNR